MTSIHSDLATIICGIATFLLVRAFLKMRTTPKYKTPPGPLKLPVIGTLYAHTLNPESLRRVGKKYGDIYSIYVGPRHMVVIQSFRMLQQASKIPELSNRGFGRSFVTRLVNPGLNGVLLSDYNRAKQARSTCLSIFREMGVGRAVMETKVLEIVQELMTSFAATNQEAFDPTKLLESSVTKIILFTTVNKKPTENDEDFRAFMNGLNSRMTAVLGTFIVNQLPLLRHLPPFKGIYSKYVDGSFEMKRHITKWVEEHIKDHQTGENDDFTELYLEKDSNFQRNTPDEFDRQQLVFLLRDLLLAGSDTTTTGLRWILLCLANRPHIQEKLKEEIHTVIGRDSTVKYQDKIRLPYLEAFIAEIQRFFSIVPLGLPHGASEDVELFGFDIPKSSLLFFNLHAIHRDERLWEEPNCFKPERFLDDENGKYKEVPHLVPFMLGKRSCLGEMLARQELFLFTANLIRCFKILPPENVCSLDEDGIIGVVYRPKRFKVRIIPL